MIYVIVTLLILLLVAAGAMLGVMIKLYRPLRAFLTWNTRYASEDYEAAVASVKTSKPARKASKTEVRGRAIKQTDELISLEDMPFEDGYAALERAANGS